MSLSHETMLELMALADGELEGEAKERAESLAARDAEARRVLEAMRSTQVRSWLNDAVAQQARAADGIADAVMEKLDAEPGPVSRASPRRVRRIAVAQAVVTSAFAIAAAVAIYLRSSGHEHETGRAPVASVRVPSGVTMASSVEVEEIDSLANVSIFEIPAATPTRPSTVVVWIDDEAGEK
jgi:hypothetical protein